jgi:hypothetical protein
MATMPRATLRFPFVVVVIVGRMRAELTMVTITVCILACSIMFALGIVKVPTPVPNALQGDDGGR